jgi:hypothetical protein
MRTYLMDNITLQVFSTILSASAASCDLQNIIKHCYAREIPNVEIYLFMEATQISCLIFCMPWQGFAGGNPQALQKVSTSRSKEDLWIYLKCWLLSSCPS